MPILDNILIASDEAMIRLMTLFPLSKFARKKISRFTGKPSW